MDKSSDFSLGQSVDSDDLAGFLTGLKSVTATTNALLAGTGSSSSPTATTPAAAPGNPAASTLGDLLGLYPGGFTPLAGGLTPASHPPQQLSPAAAAVSEVASNSATPSPRQASAARRFEVSIPANAVLGAFAAEDFGTSLITQLPAPRFTSSNAASPSSSIPRPPIGVTLGDVNPGTGDAASEAPSSPASSTISRLGSLRGTPRQLQSSLKGGTRPRSNSSPVFKRTINFSEAVNKEALPAATAADSAPAAPAAAAAGGPVLGGAGGNSVAAQQPLLSSASAGQDSAAATQSGSLSETAMGLAGAPSTAGRGTAAAAAGGGGDPSLEPSSNYFGLELDGALRRLAAIRQAEDGQPGGRVSSDSVVPVEGSVEGSGNWGDYLSAVAALRPTNQTAADGAGGGVGSGSLNSSAAGAGGRLTAGSGSLSSTGAGAGSTAAASATAAGVDQQQQRDGSRSLSRTTSSKKSYDDVMARILSSSRSLRARPDEAAAAVPSSAAAAPEPRASAGGAGSPAAPAASGPAAAGPAAEARRSPAGGLGRQPSTGAAAGALGATGRLTASTSSSALSSLNSTSTNPHGVLKKAGTERSRRASGVMFAPQDGFPYGVTGPPSPGGTLVQSPRAMAAPSAAAAADVASDMGGGGGGGAGLGGGSGSAVGELSLGTTTSGKRSLSLSAVEPQSGAPSSASSPRRQQQQQAAATEQAAEDGEGTWSFGRGFNRRTASMQQRSQQSSAPASPSAATAAAAAAAASGGGVSAGGASPAAGASLSPRQPRSSPLRGTNTAPGGPAQAAAGAGELDGSLSARRGPANPFSPGASLSRKSAGGSPGPSAAVGQGGGADAFADGRTHMLPRRPNRAVTTGGVASGGTAAAAAATAVSDGGAASRGPADAAADNSSSPARSALLARARAVIADQPAPASPTPAAQGSAGRSTPASPPVLSPFATASHGGAAAAAAAASPQQAAAGGGAGGLSASLGSASFRQRMQQQIQGGEKGGPGAELKWPSWLLPAGEATSVASAAVAGLDEQAALVRSASSSPRAQAAAAAPWADESTTATLSGSPLAAGGVGQGPGSSGVDGDAAGGQGSSGGALHSSAILNWRGLNQLLATSGFPQVQVRGLLPGSTVQTRRATAVGGGQPAEEPFNSEITLAFNRFPPDAVEAPEEQQAAAAAADVVSLYQTLHEVVRQYQRRDALVTQLLQEAEAGRARGGQEAAALSRMAKEKEAAQRAASRTQAELEELRTRQAAAHQQQLAEVQSRAASEVQKLRSALQEAEGKLAAAQASAEGGGGEVASLLSQLKGAQSSADKHGSELQRATSELARMKPYIRDLERAAASARTSARTAAADLAATQRELALLQQQRQEEVDALAAQLNAMRFKISEAEAEVAAFRSAAADREVALTAAHGRQVEELQQAAAEEASMWASELQKLKQQVSQLQQATSKSEAATRADVAAAEAEAQQLAQHAKQQSAELSRVQAECKQLREANRKLEAQLQAAQRVGVDQSQTLQRQEALLQQTVERAEAAESELQTVRTSSAQQMALAKEEATVLRAAVAELQQQLTSSSMQLQRLRAAGLTEVRPAAATAAQSTQATAAAAMTSVQPARVTRTPVPPGASDAGDTDVAEMEDAATQTQTQQQQQAMAAASSAISAAATATAAAAVQAVAEADADLATAVGRAAQAEAVAAAAEALATSLRYQLQAATAAAARHEREVEKLKERLADKVSKEERRLARDKAVYAKLRQAAAVAKRDANGRTAAGAVAAAARELRPIEIVSLYDAQRETLELELSALRAESKVLMNQLREAQNALVAKDRAYAAALATAAAGQDDSAALARERLRSASLQRELTSVRSEAAEALRGAHRKLGEAESSLSNMRGEAESLMAELQSRPTIQEVKQLRREIDLMQRKLSSMRSKAAAAAAAGEGWAAEAGEYELAMVKVSSQRSRRSTQAAIDRDKALARLGLWRVEEYPRDVLVDLLQDACIQLELSDATLLTPTLVKLGQVVAAVPRLEAFAAQVCQICLRQGVAFIPPEVLSTAPGLGPAQVPQVLTSWLQLLTVADQLQRGMQQLVAALKLSQELHHIQQQQRQQQQGYDPGADIESDLGGIPPDAVAQQAGDQRNTAAAARALNGTKHSGCGGSSSSTLFDWTQGCSSRVNAVVKEVLRLLEVEAKAVAAQQLLDMAEGCMVSQPQQLLVVVLQHCQRLLGVEGLDGVLPALNKLYVHHAELLNFFRAVGSLLALPADAGPGAAMATLQRVVVEAGREPARLRRLLQQLAEATGTWSRGGTNPPPTQETSGGTMGTDTTLGTDTTSLSSLQSLADAAADALHTAAAAAAGGGGRAAQRQQHWGAADGGGGEEDEEEGAATGAVLDSLLGSLGVVSPEAALQQQQLLKTRLERLDQVSPKYQRLATRLYDMLGVVSMEEVLARVQELQEQAQQA